MTREVNGVREKLPVIVVVTVTTLLAMYPLDSLPFTVTIELYVTSMIELRVLVIVKVRPVCALVHIGKGANEIRMMKITMSLRSEFIANPEPPISAYGSSSSLKCFVRLSDRHTTDAPGIVA